ncbi:class I SAM-dependent methyltransferase [Streptomyces sp. UNOC14_S4]|uniref:class I SAM-dependent methyltransferase n=1 Tax=Streptomyces sp. UNOC14_S4 TaxID=2872340 RepID=UPI001E5B65AE|nr:methyltransferase domain-containing protein [Streptomyces sp. UNOC14_S4]MCC3766762.1 methyltransferase domain-containing protein [Streptomyces sp. UNOC14_S4]
MSDVGNITAGHHTGHEGDYLFDPAWNRESERLRANESLWDQGTVERLERLGVGAGWSCLEVGAGQGSIVRWMAERVGPTGRILAADLDIGPLKRLENPPVELRRLDVRTDELPGAAFDLVHARMVLQHLEDPATAVRRMVRALRPGGVLFVEDTDALTLFRSAASEDFLKDVHTAAYQVMEQTGYSMRGGHFDHRAALDVGLEDVWAEGRAVMVQGGSLRARMYVLWLEYLRPELLAQGLLTEERVDEAVRAMNDPANHWLSQVLISTYGRKPA